MAASDATNETTAIIYGRPPADLADMPAGARQCSPLIPGAVSLDDIPDAAASEALVHAPPGTVERRAVLAHALRAAGPGASVTVLAPNDKGGRRLVGELEAFGCAVRSQSRRHHRIALLDRPARLDGIAEAIAAGAPRFDEALELWTQPGVFAFDRVDPGSQLLIDHLPKLAGRGADLGCGLGVLSRRALESEAVTSLAAIDIDRRAVEATARNCPDPRLTVLWADVREGIDAPSELDFVVSNPPFHDGGAEDRTLGRSFIGRAAAMLKRGGTLRLVANKHLPYEAELNERFARVALLAENGGYKLFEAKR